MTAVPAATRPERGAPAAEPRGLPFEDLVTAHEVELYRYLRRLAPSPDEAADLHQETFLRAFRAYPRLSPDANARAWLYRIAGNLARDAYRRRAVRSVVGSSSLDDHVETAGDPRHDPVARASAAETRRAVRDALLELTARQRVAVVARVLEGVDYADVAGALGCSEQTARQHVSQGLRRLRRLLATSLEFDR